MIRSVLHVSQLAAAALLAGAGAYFAAYVLIVLANIGSAIDNGSHATLGSLWSLNTPIGLVGMAAGAALAGWKLGFAPPAAARSAGLPTGGFVVVVVAAIVGGGFTMALLRDARAYHALGFNGTIGLAIAGAALTGAGAWRWLASGPPDVERR